MQTRKLALLSTMLVGIGGAALAQESTDPAQDPLLEQEQEQAGQEGNATEAQTQTQEGGDQSLTPDGGEAESDTASDAARQATGESDAGAGMAEDEAGAMAEDDAEQLEPEGGIAEQSPTDAEEPAGSSVAEGTMERTPSVGMSTEPYTASVLGEMTAEELIGTDVQDSQGDSVGAIADLLLNASGEVDRVIIDVGGFLGFGVKQVALELDRLHYDQESEVVMVDVTEDELESMSEWERDDEGWFSN